MLTPVPLWLPLFTVVLVHGWYIFASRLEATTTRQVRLATTRLASPSSSVLDAIGDPGSGRHGRAASTPLARLDPVAHSAVSVQIQASKSIMPL